MRPARSLVPLLIIVPLSGVALGGPRSSMDRALRAQLATYNIEPLDPGPNPSKDLVRLGQLLFFDKVLGGNRDTACATCHHPSFVTDDAISLSIGTGGTGLGPSRRKGDTRPFVARNATDLFNRGASEWKTMFWDFRVSGEPGSFSTPAGAQLPPGLDNVLAAQAMFPVTGRDEMRGVAGDPGNELALIADTDFQGMWAALMTRIMAIPEYRSLFARAFPTVPASNLGFQHACNAIAAFEATAFARVDSPWDRYVAGDDGALWPAAKRGALLFYGRAGCVQCHSGNLLTDQQAHNIAVPQFGPGKPPYSPLDVGCGITTGRPSDFFTFRTPPLRNVAVTGPWMHDGAYTTLEGAVRHHLAPVYALLHYDRSKLVPALQPTVLNDPQTLQKMLSTLDPLARNPPDLSDQEIGDVLAFLDSLTSPVPSLLALNLVIPDRVPSGLPVDRRFEVPFDPQQRPVAANRSTSRRKR